MKTFFSGTILFLLLFLVSIQIAVSGPMKIMPDRITFPNGSFQTVAGGSSSGQTPGNPTHVGAITDDGTTELAFAASIYVSGKYAYVASRHDNGVEILDISDPSNPTHVGAITDDGTTELDGAVSIYVSGKYAYVASMDDNGVEILDISDPSNPTHVGAITDDGTTALDGAHGIYVSGKYAYVASFGDDGVEILDISGIDAHAASIGTVSADTLQVTDNAQVGNNFHVGNGLNVGSGGFKSDGPVAFSDKFNAEGPVSINNSLIISHSTSNWGMLKLQHKNSGLQEVTMSIIEDYSAGDNGRWVIGSGPWGNSGDFVIKRGGVGTGIFLIEADGDVGINTNAIDYDLEVNGTAGKTGGGSWSDSSDERLKTNFSPIDGEEALERLSHLKGVHYEWIHPDEHQEGLRAGITAQNLEEAFPDWVSESEPTGRDRNLIPEGEKVKSISYPHDFNAYLIEAVKALKNEHEELHEMMKVLKNENESLKARIRSLEENLFQ